MVKKSRSILIGLLVCHIHVSALGQTQKADSLIDDIGSSDPKRRSVALRALAQAASEGGPEIVDALRHPDPEVRASVAAALGSSKSLQAPQVLTEALKDQNVGVRVAAARALGQLKNATAVPALIEALSDLESRVRIMSARSLGAIRDSRAVDPLRELVKDKRRAEPERRVGILALGSLTARVARNQLVAILGDSSEQPRTRAAAAAALGDIGDPEAVSSLRDQLRDPDLSVRFNTIVALGSLRDPDSVTSLVNLYRDGMQPDTIRTGILRAIGSIGGPQARAFLVAELDNQDEYLALNAARVLSLAGDAATVPALERLATQAKDDYVRQAVRTLIGSIQQ